MIIFAFIAGFIFGINYKTIYWKLKKKHPAKVPVAVKKEYYETSHQWQD